MRGQQELHLRAGPAGGRQPAQPLSEQQLCEEAQEESGHGVDDDAEHADADVGAGVAQPAGQQAQPDADRQGDHHRPEGQLKRCAAVLDDHIGDRPIVGDGGAEVEPRHIAQVVDVLHDQRLVVAGRVASLLQLLLGEPAAQRGRDRIARCDPHHEEHQGQEDPQHRQHQRQPGQRIGAK